MDKFFSRSPDNGDPKAKASATDNPSSKSTTTIGQALKRAAKGLPISATMPAAKRARVGVFGDALRRKGELPLELGTTCLRVVVPLPALQCVLSVIPKLKTEEIMIAFVHNMTPVCAHADCGQVGAWSCQADGGIVCDAHKPADDMCIAVTERHAFSGLVVLATDELTIQLRVHIPGLVLEVSDDQPHMACFTTSPKAFKKIITLATELPKGAQSAKKKPKKKLRGGPRRSAAGATPNAPSDATPIVLRLFSNHDGDDDDATTRCLQCLPRFSPASTTSRKTDSIVMWHATNIALQIPRINMLSCHLDSKTAKAITSRFDDGVGVNVLVRLHELTAAESATSVTKFRALETCTVGSDPCMSVSNVTSYMLVRLNKDMCAGTNNCIFTTAEYAVKRIRIQPVDSATVKAYSADESASSKELCSTCYDREALVRFTAVTKAGTNQHSVLQMCDSGLRYLSVLDGDAGVSMISIPVVSDTHGDGGVEGGDE